MPEDCSAETLDTDEEIFLDNILISDRARQQVFLSLQLHKAAPNPPAGWKVPACPPVPLRSVTVRVHANAPTGELILNETLRLECVEASHNGLMRYKYAYDDTATYFLLNSKHDIIHAVYHAVKSLYHRHEYHDHGADSIIHPYCCDEDFSIKTPNNPALLHYLKLFENMFLADVDWSKEVEAELAPLFRQTVTALKECPRTETERLEELLTERRKYLNIYRTIEEKYGKIIGKHTYYQALFLSRYNTFFKPESKVTCWWGKNKEQETAYKRAINIKNAYEYIQSRRTALQQFISKYAQKETDEQLHSIQKLIKASDRVSSQMNRFSVWSAVIAFVVTVLLGGLDYHYYSQSASGQSIDSLQRTVDSTRLQLHQQQQHIEQLVRQTEELKTLLLQEKSQTPAPGTAGGSSGR